MSFLRALAFIGTLTAPLITSAAASDRPPIGSYRLQISDNPSKHRFDLVLSSNNDRAICISRNEWPNADGTLPVANDQITLVTQGKSLTARSAMSSVYCPGGCGTYRLTPKKELSGSIDYEVFNVDAKTLQNDDKKTLQFKVSPTFCSK